MGEEPERAEQANQRILQKHNRHSGLLIQSKGPDPELLDNADKQKIVIFPAREGRTASRIEGGGKKWDKEVSEHPAARNPGE